MPQAPTSIEAEALALPVCAEKTDRRRSRSVPWHEGHAGVWPARTSVSNSFSHCLHAYSNRGIAHCDAIRPVLPS